MLQHLDQRWGVENAETREYQLWGPSNEETRQPEDKKKFRVALWDCRARVNFEIVLSQSTYSDKCGERSEQSNRQLARLAAVNRKLVYYQRVDSLFRATSTLCAHAATAGRGQRGGNAAAAARRQRGGSAAR